MFYVSIYCRWTITLFSGSMTPVSHKLTVPPNHGIIQCRDGGNGSMQTTWKHLRQVNLEALPIPQGEICFSGCCWSQCFSHSSCQMIECAFAFGFIKSPLLFQTVPHQLLGTLTQTTYSCAHEFTYPFSHKFT